MNIHEEPAIFVFQDCTDKEIPGRCWLLKVKYANIILELATSWQASLDIFDMPIFGVLVFEQMFRLKSELAQLSFEILISVKLYFPRPVQSNHRWQRTKWFFIFCCQSWLCRCQGSGLLGLGSWKAHFVGNYWSVMVYLIFEINRINLGKVAEKWTTYNDFSFVQLSILLFSPCKIWKKCHLL